MKVVNWGDPINFLKFGFYLARVYSGGLLFHEYTYAVFENRYRRKNDKNRENVSADGICNFSLRPFPNDQRCDNNSNRLKHIPYNVDHGCSNVNIFILAMFVIRMTIVTHERLRTFIDLIMTCRVGMLMMMVRMWITRARILMMVIMMMVGVVVFAVMMVRAWMATVRFVDACNRV